MSKVKNYFEGIIPKHKMRRRLRRVETASKKRDRMNKANNNEYGWFTGYWINDKKKVGTREKTFVPEYSYPRMVTNYYRVPVVNELTGETTYQIRSHSSIEDIVVPAHWENKRTSVSYESLKNPILKRSRCHIKPFRKEAARKFRRNQNDFSNGSHYKKDYDIAWSM